MATSNKTKASISIDKEKFDAFKEFAESRGMNFSGFVTFACTTVMTQMKSFDYLNDISDIMHRVRDTGALSDDDKKVLEAIDVANSYSPFKNV